MRSSYKRIGNYIQLIDERNRDLKVKTLLGLTVDKEFIPSVANTVGTNMANYKIIRKNQFACSLMQVRRDKKIPVALLREYDEAIISQAYPVFEIADPEELLPEYLMMWMSRSEFDREACFYAVGGVRGSLEWEDFCNMELPVPSPEKQREIVKEYQTIVNRIKLNEQLNQKLEETAQAIYKQWFVDFEFPISADYAAAIGKPELEGKPYKSSGGAMEYNDELDQEIPKGWDVGELGNLCNILDRYRKPLSGAERKEMQGPYPYYGAVSIVDHVNDYLFDGIYLLLSEDGVKVVDENGYPTLQYVWGKFWVNNHAHILKGDKFLSTEFFFLALRKTNFSHLVTGAAQPKISQKNMVSIQMVVPDNNTLQMFNKKISGIFEYIRCTTDMNRLLTPLREMVLLRMVGHKEHHEIH